jgi:hypothetical protein
VVLEVEVDEVCELLELIDDVAVDSRRDLLPLASPAGAVLEELGHLFE